MKLILAPLAALSHSGLRSLIHRFSDPDEYYSEMIHAPSLLAGGIFEEWYLRTNPVPEKLVWQLTSPRAEALSAAVPIVLRHGGIGIDVNMGCCAPPIVRSGAGFAWMLKPFETTAAMLRTVRKAIEQYELTADCAGSIRLSVKLRLGVTEDYPFLLRFCKMLEAEGVSLITLHPRLQRQSYGRPAKHEYTAQLAQDLHIPVYGNGDIDSVDAFVAAAARYPCAGWMIGRGAVQKPWLFQEIRSRVSDGCVHENAGMYSVNLEETAMLFLQLLRTEQPAAFHTTRAQRFFQFFCANFSFAHYCKTKLLHAAGLEEAEAELRAYFEQVPQDRVLRYGGDLMLG